MLKSLQFLTASRVKRGVGIYHNSISVARQSLSTIVTDNKMPNETSAHSKSNIETSVPVTEKRTENNRTPYRTPYVFANINLLKSEIEILRKRVQLQEEVNLNITKKLRRLRTQQHQDSSKDSDSDSGFETSEASVEDTIRSTPPDNKVVSDETFVIPENDKALQEENQALKAEIKELKNSLLLTANKVYAKEVANKTDENVRLYLIGKASIYEQTVTRADIRSLKTFLLFLNEPEKVFNHPDSLKAWNTLFPTQESIDVVKERLKEVMTDHPKLISSIITLKDQWPTSTRRINIPTHIELDDLIRYFQQTNEDDRIVSALKECRVFYYKTKIVRTLWQRFPL